MLLIAVAVAGLFALVGGVLAWRVIAPVLDRVLRLAERRLDIAEEQGKRSPVPRGEPMPTDLLAEAMQLRDEWARQDRLRWLTEQYTEYGSWDAVRNVLAMGPQ